MPRQLRPAKPVQSGPVLALPCQRCLGTPGQARRRHASHALPRRAVPSHASGAMPRLASPRRASPRQRCPAAPRRTAPCHASGARPCQRCHTAPCLAAPCPASGAWPRPAWPRHASHTVPLVITGPQTIRIPGQPNPSSPAALLQRQPAYPHGRSGSAHHSRSTSQRQT